MDGWDGMSNVSTVLYGVEGRLRREGGGLEEKALVAARHGEDGLACMCIDSGPSIRTCSPSAFVGVFAVALCFAQQSLWDTSPLLTQMS